MKISFEENVLRVTNIPVTSVPKVIPPKRTVNTQNPVKGMEKTCEGRNNLAPFKGKDFRPYFISDFQLKNTQKNSHAQNKNIQCANQINFTGLRPPTDAQIEEFTNYINPMFEQLNEKMLAIGTDDPKLLMKSKKVYEFFKDAGKEAGNKYELLGVGTKSICYKLKGNDGEDYAIKFLRPDAIAKGTDAYSYEAEAYALQKVEEAGIANAQRFVNLYSQDGRNYLITTVSKGKPLSVSKNFTLNQNKITDLLKKLTRLDQFGFIQYDAQINNVHFDGDIAELIDLGGYSLSIQDKATLDYAREFRMPFDYGTYYPALSTIDNGYIEAHGVRDLLKTTKPLLGFSDIDSASLSRTSNPHFSAFSNVANYEYRSLYGHLTGITNKGEGKEKAKELFTTYLRTRVREYHEPMSAFFRQLDPKEVACACQDDLQTVTQRIKDATFYETTLSSLLTWDNIDENILRTELAKIQMRWVMDEAPQHAEEQYEKLLNMISSFADDNPRIPRQYYHDAIAYFEQIHKGFNYLKSQDLKHHLSEKCDLVEIFYGTAPNSGKNAAQNTRNAGEAILNFFNFDGIGNFIRKNKATAGAFAGIALAGGIIAGIAVNRKNNDIKHTNQKKQTSYEPRLRPKEPVQTGVNSSFDMQNYLKSVK